jgi:hypothetical protein
MVVKSKKAKATRRQSKNAVEDSGAQKKALRLTAVHAQRRGHPLGVNGVREEKNKEIPRKQIYKKKTNSTPNTTGY